MATIASTGQPMQTRLAPQSAPSSALGTAMRLRDNRLLVWIFVFALIITACLVTWLFRHDILNLATFTSILMAVFLGLLPPLICVVQSTTRERQLRKLESLVGRPIERTAFFQSAHTSIEAIEPASVDNDYRVPLTTLFVMNCAGFGLIFTALFVPDYFGQGYVLLLGLNRPDDVPVSLWQQHSFTIVGMAFVGSYVYTIGRLLDRVNNADLYPISLHYYVARPIIACLAAVVLRHTASIWGAGSAASSATLMLLAFAMGLSPDLFLLALARRAFQWMKIWGARSEPETKARPASLPLLMVDDLTREKIDRLQELGIDSAHALAYQNPFLLWPRLPFELGLLVDWISQALLFTLVGADKLMALRSICVMNIFDLALRLEEGHDRDALCHVLGIVPAAADTLLHQIRTDQAYSRLLEVRDAMLPSARAPHEAGPPIGE